MSLILWIVSVARGMSNRLHGWAWSCYDFADALIERLRREWRDEGLANRAQLLKRRFREADDHCDAFRPGKPGTGDCETDGHYLCVWCNRMSYNAAVDRELIEVTDGE